MRDTGNVFTSASAHARGACLFLLSLSASFACCGAQSIMVQGPKDSGFVELEAIAPGVVRVHVQPAGRTGVRTPVIDPALKPLAETGFHRDGQSLLSPTMSATLLPGPSVEVRDGTGTLLLTLVNPLDEVRHTDLRIDHDETELLYGMRGFDRFANGDSFTRTGGEDIAAGVQGDAGGPFFFTRRYGVLIDSDGGGFIARDGTLHFGHSSRGDAEVFLMAGPPKDVMRSLALVTGHAPMPPKWTLGFLNSQWGSSETELRAVAQRYQAERIPLSGFILDYDWKAWGEDQYGEWRWNAKNFPEGPSGRFAQDLAASGVHLAGILKPRILVDTPDGKPTDASAYASAHDFWYPDEKRTKDGITHRLVGNLDFRKADERAWFWEHLRLAFKAGMTAWWNDEADYSSTTTFSNFQFLNMGRMLYDGQRADSDERVWSINRNYYLGATRYGYAEWSGDIGTGFQSMAVQRRRMIATLNLGEPHWSMDTGGFGGHPTPENYARWVEFAAFVPILRVHGDYNEKRQPWVYGPVAAAAATRAIRLRYELMPYVYSAERETTITGLGLVRPLFWEFPDDPHVADDDRAWMFGDALLVSPVVAHDEQVHQFYLPAGEWFDYASGRAIEGGREMTIAVDNNTWADIPLYVRAGSILATQPNVGSNELSPKAPLQLDIFPSAARQANFAVYDDDGHTYAYEKGAFFRQMVQAGTRSGVTEIDFGKVEGSFQPSLPSYVVRLHTPAHNLTVSSGKLKHFADESAWGASSEPGWAASEDRFGTVTLLRLPVVRGGIRITVQ